MNKLAICAIFKNEAPFLLEWIAYHRVHGVDHFVLYDNDSNDGGAELIRESSLGRYCTVIHWPQRPGQLPAYRDFIQRHAARFEWAAFIDIDEFLHPTGETGLSELFEAWRPFSAVLVNWRIFGPSGHADRPAGLAIESYTRRAPDDTPANQTVKSIVRSSELLDATDNAHMFQLRGLVCNTAGRWVSNAPLQPEPCFENLVLHHYITRSRVDWMAKLQRGHVLSEDSSVAYTTEMFDHFEQLSYIEDRTIMRWAPQVRDVMGEASMAGPAPQQDIAIGYELVRLERGLFGVALPGGGADGKDGLPAARISVAPAPAAAQRNLATISSSRADGWLTQGDEPTLVRASADGVEVMATVYWRAASGEAGRPRLAWARLDAEPKAAPVPGREDMPDEPNVGEGEVLAHIQDVGDVRGRVGEWIGRPQSGRWIEGFLIGRLPGIPANDVQFRAVLGQNWMSPWLAGVRLCGSRGLALPLRGFCLRLGGVSAQRFDCTYTARFTDGVQIGPCAGGQVCAASSLSPLEALQITIRPRG